jgi:hypothetical protein
MNALDDSGIYLRKEIDFGIIHNCVTETKSTEEAPIRFGVGMSQDWDPYRAGIEATRKAVIQLGGTQPKFIIIFCTAYYARMKNGLSRMLKAPEDILPQNVHLIGGVTTAFICPEGCFSRGVAVIAGGGPGIDICSAFDGGIIRRNPKKAGHIVSTAIERSFRQSKKKHKVLIEVMPSPREPPQASSETTQSLIRILPQKAVILLRSAIFELAIQFLQYGQGRETEALEEISKTLDDCYIIGTSTFDDFRDIDHYQFYKNKVTEGGIAALGLSFDNEMLFEHEPPKVRRSGKTMSIKRGWRNLCIDQVNGKPAVSEFLKILDWPKDYAEPHIRQIFHRNYYYPLGYEEDGRLITFPAGFFMGETINTNREIRTERVEIMYTSCDEIFKSLKGFLERIQNRKTVFTLLFDASEVPGFLGDKLYSMKNMIDDATKGSPYLIIFGAGEHSKKPGERALFNNFSRVDLSIFDTD